MIRSNGTSTSNGLFPALPHQMAVHPPLLPQMAIQSALLPQTLTDSLISDYASIDTNEIMITH